MGPSLRVRVGDPRLGPIFRFGRDRIYVGRHPQNDLVLPHESVPWEYAQLERSEHVRGPAYRLTVFERQDVDWLRGDEPFRIGSYELRVLDREPPDATEMAFLQALERAPTDDDTRTVYADWLEESGHPNAAAFLRAQVELRGLDPGDASFGALSRRIRAIEDELGSSWRRAVGRPPIESCAHASCPKAWDCLTLTDNPAERQCATCDKRVPYFMMVWQAREHAQAGGGVVVDTVQRRMQNDLKEDVEMLARMRGHRSPRF